ncbi:hypothetical protein V6Z12_D04G074400 [Gossypium hirsutum]
MLSLAGMTTLAKSVLAIIPTYIMQTMLVSKRVGLELEKIIRGFVWGPTDARKEIHLVGLDWLCNNVNEGGLGLQNMVDLNHSFLMKICFQIAQNIDQLWVKVLHNKYQEISQVWDFVKKGVCWKIGNGRAIDFWRDVWLSGSSLFIEHAKVPRFSPTNFIIVKDMMDEDGRIVAVVLPFASDLNDMLGWKWESSRCFSIKTTYGFL